MRRTNRAAGPQDPWTRSLSRERIILRERCTYSYHTTCVFTDAMALPSGLNQGVPGLCGDNPLGLIDNYIFLHFITQLISWHLFLGEIRGDTHNPGIYNLKNVFLQRTAIYFSSLFINSSRVSDFISRFLSRSGVFTCRRYQLFHLNHLRHDCNEV